jgi:hypothetical protein
MRQGQPGLSPPAAFSALNVVHLAFVGAVIVYFVTGEIISSQVEDFRPGGLVDLDSAMIWAVRGMLMVTGIGALILAHTYFSDESFVPRVLSRQGDVDDAAVAAALQTAHVIRLALTEGVAIYGLTLFICNGHRYDLYGFGAVALLNLAVLRPGRDRWEVVYRDAALKYEGVSSSPWMPQS